MKTYQVLWQDKRGAGNMRTFTSPGNLIEFLKGLRKNATVKLDNREVGRVWQEPNDGNPGKWRWFFDPAEMPSTEEKQNVPD